MARFQGKIILVDTDVIVEWGILTAHAESTGKPMPAIDALIAATAKVNQLTLVTRNVSDFDAADMKVLNPLGLKQTLLPQIHTNSLTPLANERKLTTTSWLGCPPHPGRLVIL